MNLHEDLICDFLEGCYKAGIKDPLRFLIDKMPRTYGYLKGAFPRGILPTDVDGEVELNGSFLRLEFKHESTLRNGHIPKGQKMLFDALRRTGKFTIFICGHDSSGLITCMQIYSGYGDSSKFTWIDPCSNADMRHFCSRWAKKYDPSFHAEPHPKQAG